MLYSHATVFSGWNRFTNSDAHAVLSRHADLASFSGIHMQQGLQDQPPPDQSSGAPDHAGKHTFHIQTSHARGASI